MTEPKQTLKQKAYHELKEFFIIALYLWLIFVVLLLYKSVILSEQNIGFIAHGLAILNALALAKVILIAKAFHFAERFKEEPLIYPTVFKSLAFAIILGVFKILEEIGVGMYHGRSVSASIAEVGGGTLKGILSLVLLLAVILVPFFGFTEIGEALGEGKLKTLFLDSRHGESNS